MNLKCVPRILTSLENNPWKTWLENFLKNKKQAFPFPLNPFPNDKFLD